MSDSIEEVLRALTRKGDLNHVSLGFVNGAYECVYRGVMGKDFRTARHSDPASAILSALTGKKIEDSRAPRKAAPAPRRSPPKASPPATKSVFDDLL